MKESTITNEELRHEEWRRCQYPFVRFEVSNLGRVRHARTKKVRKLWITAEVIGGLIQDRANYTHTSRLRWFSARVGKKACR